MAAAAMLNLLFLFILVKWSIFGGSRLRLCKISFIYVNRRLSYCCFCKSLRWRKVGPILSCCVLIGYQNLLCIILAYVLMFTFFCFNCVQFFCELNAYCIAFVRLTVQVYTGRRRVQPQRAIQRSTSSSFDHALVSITSSAARLSRAVSRVLARRREI